MHQQPFNQELKEILSNSCAGCAAIFTSRVLNNKPPYIFENGNQTRGFIHVKGVAEANLDALERNNEDYKAINIGTGKPSQSHMLPSD